MTAQKGADITILSFRAETPCPPQKPNRCFSLYENVVSPYCAHPRLGVRAAWGFFITFADDGPRPDQVEAVETILDVGAEGGALTIEGSRTANGWRFRAIRNEYALMD